MPGVFTRRPITSTSGILPLPAPIAVFAGRSSASIVIEAMSLTSRCLSLDDTGAFATNNPFGSVPFCSGIAAEAGSPSVRADTSPQCATVRCAAVIIGLLVFASGGRPACAHCSNPNPIRALRRG